jgi:hypothetical protein
MGCPKCGNDTFENAGVETCIVRAWYDENGDIMETDHVEFIDFEPQENFSCSECSTEYETVPQGRGVFAWPLIQPVKHI